MWALHSGVLLVPLKTEKKDLEKNDLILENLENKAHLNESRKITNPYESYSDWASISINWKCFFAFKDDHSFHPLKLKYMRLWQALGN